MFFGNIFEIMINYGVSVNLCNCYVVYGIECFMVVNFFIKVLFRSVGVCGY